MPQEYRTIPGDETAHNIDSHSFELETAHSRHNDSSVRRNFVHVLACLFALLLLVVGYGVHQVGGGNDSSTEVPAAPFNGDQPEIEKQKVEAASETPIDRQNGQEEGMPTAQSVKPKMIFCYGDSLTYGMSPPSREAYPYSEYLMQELNLLFDPDAETKTPATIVQHAGFPGWTSSQMLDYINSDQGMCFVIARNPTLSLLIILAGTNDLAGVTNSEKSVARSIVDSIVNLHKGAISCAGGESNSRFHTLAIGIPGSAFQEKVHVMSELSAYVNDGLKKFAASSIGGQVSYVEFPFQYQDGDTKWSVDGLHLSKEGYEELGKQLAPEVKIILDSIDVNN